MRTLTAKGNATEAARVAGYAGNRAALVQIGGKTRRQLLIVAASEAELGRIRRELMRRGGPE